MIANYFRIFSLVLFVSLYVFSYIPIIVREINYPSNPVKEVSWYILFTLLITLVTVILSVIYQAVVIRYGAAPLWFKQTVTITTTVGGFANMALLWLIFHFRFKDK